MSTQQSKALGFGLNPQDDLNDLRISDKAIPLLEHVKRFVTETVDPMSEKFYKLGEGRPNRWEYAPGQLELLDGGRKLGMSGCIAFICRQQAWVRE